MSIELYDQTNIYFRDLVDYLYKHGGEFAEKREEAEKAANRAGILLEDMQDLILARWREHVGDAISDGILTHSEEENLGGILKAFELRDRGADDDDSINTLVKLATIRDLEGGNPYQRFDNGAIIPFKMQKGEILLWKTQNVELRETVTKRKVNGKSIGASIKVMKGVYIRPSAFSAAPVSTEAVQQTDEGDLFLTNKHLYFDGKKKHLKLKFSSLANIKPYSDGLELQKATQSATPFFLFPLDGWFHYNAIQAS